MNDFTGTKGEEIKMKKIVSFVTLFFIVFGICNVYAAGEHGNLSERVIVKEDFNTGINFEAYSSFVNDTWERFVDGDDGTETTVSVKDGVAKITGLAGNSVGFLYRFEPVSSEFFVTFRARCTKGNPNHLRLQVFYNKIKKFRFSYILPTGTLKANEWTTVCAHFTQGKQVVFYKKADGDTVYTRAGQIAAADCTWAISNWDQIKFFVEKSASDFEIDDFKVVALEPDENGVYLAEDFESASNMSDVAEDGICTSHNPDYAELVTEDDGNRALQLTVPASGTVIADTGCTVEKFRVPSVLPQEFYFSFRAKNDKDAPANRLWINFMLSGGTDSDARETATKRIQVYADVSQGGGRNGDGNFTTLAGDHGLTPGEWINFVFHIKGEQYEVYWKTESEENYVKGMELTNASSYSAGNNPNVNQLKFYAENGTGSVLIDDIRIYTPGMHKMDTRLKRSGQGALEAELNIMGDIGDTQQVTGILAVYDSQDMMKAAEVTETTVDGAMAAGGKIRVKIDNVPTGADYAIFYFWDSMNSLQPLDMWIDFPDLSQI